MGVVPWRQRTQHDTPRISTCESIRRVTRRVGAWNGERIISQDRAQDPESSGESPEPLRTSMASQGIPAKSMRYADWSKHHDHKHCRMQYLQSCHKRPDASSIMFLLCRMSKAMCQAFFVQFYYWWRFNHHCKIRFNACQHQCTLGWRFVFLIDEKHLNPWESL
jgi:hypothetical protein